MEFYIQRHLSGFLGNAPFWWRHGGQGYSAYLEQAERFSQERAEKICGVPVGEKGEKYRAWPCDFIDSRARKVFDFQDEDHLEQWKATPPKDNGGKE